MALGRSDGQPGLTRQVRDRGQRLTRPDSPDRSGPATGSECRWFGSGACTSMTYRPMLIKVTVLVMAGSPTHVCHG